MEQLRKDDGSMPSAIPWAKLSKAAWEALGNAWLDKNGRTKVGAAVITEMGMIYGGCNIQHRYRSHDLHAEPVAIGNAVANGAKWIEGILVVAERENFTPCGACMDWIVEVGGLDCEVAVQHHPDKGPIIFKARMLMPHYPGLVNPHPRTRWEPVTDG